MLASVKKAKISGWKGKGENLGLIDINYFMNKGNGNLTETDMGLNRTFSSLYLVFPHKLKI